MKLFFDTSGIPRSLSKLGQAFESLQELVAAKLVHVHIPELVKRERQSQVSGELSATKKAVKDLLAGSGAANPALKEQYEQLTGVLEKEGSEDEQAEKLMQGFLQSIDANILSSDSGDLDDMWNLYFSGSGPFSEAKRRKDIPDAFVYLSAVTLVKQDDEQELHCIVADGNLAKAIGAIKGCTVHTSLKKFFEEDEGKGVLAQLAWDKEWEESKSVAIQGATASEAAYLQPLDEAVGEIIPDWSIDDGLPGSGGTVMGGYAVDTGNYQIDWDAAESLGPGWLSIPFSGTIECEYEYGVYGIEAFNLPSRIHVQFADMERDKISEANCVATMSLEGQLFLKFTKEQFDSKSWDSGTIEVELDNLQVSETEDFEDDDYDWDPPGSEMFQ